MRLLFVAQDGQAASSIVRGLLGRGFDILVEHVDDFDPNGNACLPLDAIVFAYDLERAATECAKLRIVGIETPVVALVTVAPDSDAVAAALDAGIDACVVNSGPMDNLVAQLRQLARRDHSTLAWRELLLDLRTRVATARGRRMNLTSREFSALAALVRHPHLVVSRAVLEDRVWGRPAPSTNALEVLIGRVRRKLDDADSSSTVVARRGAGYLIAATGTNDAGPSQS
jgi:DNA-binding response OmpR family regulator